MHVLIIPSWYKIPERPVVGSFFVEQAKMLKDRGLRVGVFYPLFQRFSRRWNPEPDLHQPDDYDDDGIPTHHNFVCGLLPRAHRLNDWHLCRSSARKFSAYVAQFGKPDLIHSHALFHGGLVARRLATELRIPFVHTEHLSMLVHGSAWPTRYKTFWAHKVYGDAAALAVVGSKFRDDLAAEFGLPPESLAVVPNMVSEQFLAAARARPMSRPFTFLTCSFFNPVKNHRLLLDAFKILAGRDPQVSLRIGGYGPLEDEVKAHASRLELGDRIQFLGRLDRDSVVDELQRAHAFVSTSRYETFGVALVEALAVGRPVVATDSGGPRDFVDAENGVLVPEHEPEPLADAMTTLVQRYDSYDQHSIAARCDTRFSGRAVGDELESIYERALSGQANAGLSQSRLHLSI